MFLYSFLIIFELHKNQDQIAPDDHLLKSLLAWVSFEACPSKHTKFPLLWLMIFSHRWLCCTDGWVGQEEPGERDQGLHKVLAYALDLFAHSWQIWIWFVLAESIWVGIYLMSM